MEANETKCDQERTEDGKCIILTIALKFSTTDHFLKCCLIVVYSCKVFSVERVYFMGMQINWEDATCRQHTFFQISILLSRRRKWQLIPVLLSRESHGQRSLLGYNPRNHKESDTTEQRTNTQREVGDVPSKKQIRC